MKECLRNCQSKALSVSSFKIHLTERLLDIEMRLKVDIDIDFLTLMQIIIGLHSFALPRWILQAVRAHCGPDRPGGHPALPKR